MKEADILKKLSLLRSDGKSQDPIDALGGELEVATIIKRYAEKRHKSAVEAITDMDPANVAETKARASKNNMKSEHVWRGSEKIVTVSCNAPVERVDPKAFYVELIKLGVAKETVDKAQKAATKANAPATSFSAVSA